MATFPVSTGDQNTVLGIVQAFCRTYAQPVPTALKGVSDAGALQMRGMLQEVGDFILDFGDWQWAERDAQWISVAAESQGFLPTLLADDVHSVVPGTLWDQTERLLVPGPVSPQQRQAYKTGFVSPYRRFWVSGQALHIYPTMPAGHTMTLVYRSNHWLVKSSGTTASFIDEDTDRPLPSRRLMTAGLAFYWKRAKEMPYAVEEARFMDLLADEASRNIVRRPVQMDTNEIAPRPGIVVPQGNWGT